MGANLVAGGATFRAWAPHAKEVHVLGDFKSWTQGEASKLVRDAQGYWAGFVPGLSDNALYKFFVVGEGSSGWKRDPYGRELDRDFDINNESRDLVNRVVRDPHTFPWHDRDFRPPPFNDLILYQLHIGTFHAVDSQGLDTRPSRIAKYLDVLKRVEYLATLGVNAVQLLPVVESSTRFTLGYNGTDYFSPEFTYAVPDAEFDPYLDEVNKRLTEKQQPPVVRS
jgi:1,4-alpha-glucan branching enzyme